MPIDVNALEPGAMHMLGTGFSAYEDHLHAISTNSSLQSQSVHVCQPCRCGMQQASHRLPET
jgi:hypothetical protein